MSAPDAMVNAVEFYRVLSQRAQTGAKPITYTELAIKIGHPRWVSPFGASLYIIAAYLLLKGLPPLTALVVNAESRTTQEWLLRGNTIEQTLEAAKNHPWAPDPF